MAEKYRNRDLHQILNLKILLEDRTQDVQNHCADEGVRDLLAHFGVSLNGLPSHLCHDAVQIVQMISFVASASKAYHVPGVLESQMELDLTAQAEREQEIVD